jgi:hypothetical protein
VSAEQKLEAIGHGDPDIGLRSAPITAIGGVQCALDN